VPISKIVVVASGAAAIVAAVVIAIVVRSPSTTKPHRGHAPKPRPVEAPSTTAFTAGGVPLRDPDVEAVLADSVADWGDRPIDERDDKPASRESS
jgi:hypothetical protein